MLMDAWRIEVVEDVDTFNFSTVIIAHDVVFGEPLDADET
jgi:hypothetical protein